MKPNILLIFADELRADHLGCFGHPVVQTPNLDRLAARGCRFDQCMIAQPTCTPCRASVLTGCYPSTIRSRMVGCVTPDDPRFLPRVLGEAGYRTRSIGKIQLAPQGEEPRRVEETRTAAGDVDYYGFHDVDLVNGHGDRCFGNGYSPWLRERVPDLDQRRDGKHSLPHASKALADRGLGPYSYELPLETHSSCYIADRAVKALKAAADGAEPFFLHVSFPDPHHPFTVPEPYAGRYRPRGRCAALARAYRGDRTHHAALAHAGRAAGQPRVPQRHEERQRHRHDRRASTLKWTATPGGRCAPPPTG